MYRDIFHAIRIAMQFAKNRDIVYTRLIQIDKYSVLPNQKLISSKLEFYVKSRDYRWYWSITFHGRQNLPFSGNLAEKASCVVDKTVVSLHILNNLFLNDLLKSSNKPWWQN